MYCKQGIIGAQFSHPQRGHAMCCATGERFFEKPKIVWQNSLAPARAKLLGNQKIKACESCYQQEAQKVMSFRQVYNKQFQEQVGLGWVTDTKNDVLVKKRKIYFELENSQRRTYQKMANSCYKNKNRKKNGCRNDNWK